MAMMAMTGRTLVLSSWLALCLAGPTLAQAGSETRATCGSDAASASPDEREAICLRELAGRARREGNLLSLRLANGAMKAFRNNPAACHNDDAAKCIDFRLVGFHSASQRYLVFVSGYEDFQCWLVSARTGKATTFRNIPHFAPDGQTFFVTGYDGMYDNWLGVGSVASDPPALLWEQAANLYETWDFVRWIDNDRVAIHEKAENEGCPQGNCDAILKRTGTAWTFERVHSRLE